MTRKPTRRGIRRRSTRHRSGGTVYQNDATLDSSAAADALAGNARIGTPEHVRQRAAAEQTTLSRDEVAQALVELLDRSGWKRLEVCRSTSGTPRVGGYCVDADGNHLDVADLL